MAVGFKFTQSDGRVTDIDDLLVRRDLFNDGSLWTWGDNTWGQLGDGTTTSRSSPGTTTGGGINWKQLSDGQIHGIAIKTDGTLWSWGNNSYGQLGDSTTTNRSSPGTTTDGGTNWKQVSAGSYHSAAIKTDGTLWAWGGVGFPGILNAIGTGASTPTPTQITGTTWKQVSCGYHHSGAIKTDGSLWAWGSNSTGGVGDGTTTPRPTPVTTAGGGYDWIQVSAGWYNVGGIKTAGTLWTWGQDTYGALGAGTTNTHRSSPGQIAGGGTDWKQLKLYGYGGCAIKTDGTLWTWGINIGGILGDGTTTNRSSPVTTAGGGTTWKQAVIGGYSGTSGGIKTDGTLWTWGSGAAGALGDNSVTNKSSPVTTAGGGNNWKQLSGGVGLMALKDLTI